jgi:hypothetical protein
LTGAREHTDHLLCTAHIARSFLRRFFQHS